MRADSADSSPPLLCIQAPSASIAVKRLDDIMDAPAEPYALTPSRTAEGRGQIQVADLAFRYPPEHPFLYRNLSLALKPGKLTVLTGPSGCGKSTLAKLTVNRLKGVATILFIAHQLPKGLAVDEVFVLHADKAMQIGVIEEAQN